MPVSLGTSLPWRRLHPAAPLALFRPPLHNRVRLCITDWHDQAGVGLRQEQRVLAQYRGEPGKPLSHDDSPLFLVVYVNSTEEPVACGGLRQLGRDSAEIKRTFVVPHLRGKAARDWTLSPLWLEKQAVQRGLNDLRLETGVMMDRAIIVYERKGYRGIPNFGSYAGVAHSCRFAKDLSRKV